MSVNKKMTDIADRLRGYASTTDKLSLDDMTNEIDRAFGQGFWMASAFESFVNNDRFWDLVQCNGKRTNYYYAFANSNFTDDVLKEAKYKIKPLKAECMFRSNTSITDISGINMDTSDCTEFKGFCMACSNLTKVGEMNLTKAISANAMFASCVNLTDIGPLVVSEDTVLAFGTFSKTINLTTVTFSGELGCTIAFQKSPLSKASIENIIEHLSDTATGQSVFLLSGQVDKVFETSEGANDGTTSAEWLALVGSKPYWSISV